MKMTVNEIESLGKDVQRDISEAMTQLLKDTKCIDLGASGACLSELSSTSNAITKRLEPKGILRPMLNTRKWLARFDNVEHSMDSLEQSIKIECDKLNTVLSGLMENRVILQSKLTDLKEVHTKLDGIVKELQENPEDDDLKLRAAVNRLKVIATTEALTSQEIGKTLLTIQENKEITNQLMEASDNIIPMFKTMMMTALATQINRKAVELRKSLVKTANKIVVENAKQIESTAKDLIVGREEALISPSTLKEANDILQRTINNVMDKAKTETDVNLEVVDSLMESVSSLSRIANLEGE